MLLMLLMLLLSGGLCRVYHARTGRLVLLKFAGACCLIVNLPSPTHSQ